MKIVTLAGFWAIASLAFAHGTMKYPPSRVYACYLENPEFLNSEACKAAAAENGTAMFYNWNEVNALAGGKHKELISDGKLCSAGRPSFSGLDLARNDWKTETIIADPTGNFEFVYFGTAPHATETFQFYISKDSYDPLQPLTWGDLEDEPFCDSGKISAVNGIYRISCPLPAGKLGRRLIYNIWQRSDSPEAFYACLDIVIEGGDNNLLQD